MIQIRGYLYKCGNRDNKEKGAIMRIPRKYIETSFFHIMVQGINKEYIFKYENDKRKYIKILKNNKKEFRILILSYCIMNNHSHFLIHSENINELSNFMHKVNMLYAMYYNKEHNRIGYVFRDRYKLQPIKNEGHILSCIKYIHENPVKAKLCSNPEEYKYSSCTENEFENREILEKVNEILQNTIKEDKKEDFILMEEVRDKEDLCKELICNFIVQNNINTKDLKKNKKILNNIVVELNKKYGISYRVMEKYLNISRETLRIIVKKYDEGSKKDE